MISFIFYFGEYRYGCKYCMQNSNRKMYDSDSLLLIGEVKECGVVKRGHGT